MNDKTTQHPTIHCAPTANMTPPVCECNVTVPDALRRLAMPRPNAWVCAGIAVFSFAQLSASSWWNGEVAVLQAPTSLSWDNELLRIHQAGGKQGGRTSLLSARQLSSLKTNTKALKAPSPLVIQHNQAWIARTIESQGEFVGMIFEFDAGQVIEQRVMAVYKTPMRRSKKSLSKFPRRMGKTRSPRQLDPKILYTKMSRSMHKLKSCYSQSLKKNPKSGGKLFLDIEFKRQKKAYRVVRVTTREKTIDDGTSQCIVRAFKKLHLRNMPTHTPKRFSVTQHFAFSTAK